MRVAATRRGETHAAIKAVHNGRLGVSLEGRGRSGRCVECVEAGGTGAEGEAAINASSRNTSAGQNTLRFAREVVVCYDAGLLRNAARTGINRTIWIASPSPNPLTSKNFERLPQLPILLQPHHSHRLRIREQEPRIALTLRSPLRKFPLKEVLANLLRRTERGVSEGAMAHPARRVVRAGMEESGKDGPVLNEETCRVLEA